MKRHIILLAFVLFSLNIYSQNSHSGKLIGGMYLNAGYLNRIDDVALGIGGKLSFGLCDYFRVGMEGYGSSATYKKDGSFYSLGWGGLLGEFVYAYKKSSLIIGLTIGGGSNKQMEIVIDNNSFGTYDVVKLDKKGAFVTTPFLSYEYKISSKANLSAKIDYVMSPTGNIFNKGFRLYLGCLFNMMN